MLREWCLPSEPGREKQAADEIARVVLSCTPSESRILEMKTAVTEACLNAIEHGNHMDCLKSIKVALQISDTEYVIRICDEGEGFAMQAQALNRSRSIWEDVEIEPRGWGLQFMHSFADQIETVWIEGVFCVSMHFYKGTVT